MVKILTHPFFGYIHFDFNVIMVSFLEFIVRGKQQSG